MTRAEGLLQTKSAIAYLSIAIIASIVMACPLYAEAALQITSPTSGTVVRPGQTIAVSVSTSGGTFTGVFIASPATKGLEPLLTAPPFQFLITIATDIAPGIYKLTAMGATATSTLLASPSISIDVERSDSPQKIRVEPSSILSLSTGAGVGLILVGEYSGGNIVDLSNSTMTTFESESPRVASVTKDGSVEAVGLGSTKIVIKHKTLKITVDVVVTMRH